MVIDEQDLISSHKVKVHADTPASLTRWLQHFFYMQWRTWHYFNQAARLHIQQAVTQAEQGHAGEIQVIIEGHFPLNMAWTVSTKSRAQQLFALYGVWDTEHNSGVLLYINLCERRVEIVADRGINRFVAAEHWQQLCMQITMLLAEGEYLNAVKQGIELLGKTLHEFYTADDTKGVVNELSDAAIFL